MKLAINKVSQRGYSEKLGTSAVTIDQYGCALACLTMIENYYGFKVDILELNNLLIEKKVYRERNLMNWWDVEKVNEFVKCKDWINCPTTPAPLEKVDGELNEGRPIIAHVDLNPNQAGADHFILIIGKTEDGHYLAHDPWFKDEDAIFFDARYGDPKKGIFGLRLITGPVPQQEAPKPSEADLTGQIDQYQKHIEDIKEHLRPAGIMPQDDFPKVIGAIDELLVIKKNYMTLLEKQKAEDEKPKEEELSEEEFMGQIKIWNLILKVFIQREVSVNG